ncbi:Stress response protein YsnF [Corynebacterium kalinowskii]|uniref:Stress response protein YsnF n=1 Tax=Corynebacterium kalinowskii TaxID=2675216 RepID=A0A6B8VSF7_9CORY|nr:PRC and DUF2382 domain-containing protein [Corynebacterium kalinowskii]QGU01666.1 Stress response protein YsnF [Corynebacterium kalinowskii]
MTNKNIRDLFNATAFDNSGEKLGGVKEIFVDDNSGQPTFVEVGHGLFGMASSIVPLRGHTFNGDDLKLAFSKDRIKDAPNLDVNNALTPSDQNRVYEHFGLTGTTDTERYESGAGFAGTGAAAHDDRHRDLHRDGDRDFDRDADLDRDRRDLTDIDGDRDSLVRSEERLTVDKENVQTGEARLRKYVVEDTETIEVPVTREEVRVERTPIDGDSHKGGIRGAGIGEEEASVTLHEERVTVNKETVPVEEVRLEKDTVRDTETVSEEIRKEKIEVDGVETDRDLNRRR